MKPSTNENLRHSMKGWLASWMSIPASNWLLLKLCCTKFVSSTNPSIHPPHQQFSAIQSVPVIGPSSSQQMPPSWESAKCVTDCIRIHTLISILDLDNDDKLIDASNFLSPWLLFGFCQWSKWDKIYSFVKLRVFLERRPPSSFWSAQSIVLPTSEKWRWKTVYRQ